MSPIRALTQTLRVRVCVFGGRVGESFGQHERQLVRGRGRRLLTGVRATGPKRILTVFGAEGLHTTKETRAELGTILDTFVGAPPPKQFHQCLPGMCGGSQMLRKVLLGSCSHARLLMGDATLLRAA